MDIAKMINFSQSTASASSSASNISITATHSASSTSSPSTLCLGLLICYTEEVLCTLTEKSVAIENEDGVLQDLPHKIIESRKKLRNIVQLIAPDFKRFFKGISEGAKMLADQKSFTANFSSEAHTVAMVVLRGLESTQWAAAGLLAIANVLERLETVSTHDKECIDLLKGMLDLAKFIKQLKAINADLHREIFQKMSEAIQLIANGAILCHSFIRASKLSKLLLTPKISVELVHIRVKVESMKSNLLLQMQDMIMSSLTIYMSREQPYSDDSDTDHVHSGSDDSDQTVKIDSFSEEFHDAYSYSVDGAGLEKRDCEFHDAQSHNDSVDAEESHLWQSNSGIVDINYCERYEREIDSPEWKTDCPRHEEGPSTETSSHVEDNSSGELEKGCEPEIKKAESESNCIAQEISPIETSNPVEGEIVEDISETETRTWTDSSIQERSTGFVRYNKPIKNRHQLQKLLPRSFLKFGKRLKVTAYNLKGIAGGRKKTLPDVLGPTLEESHIRFAQLSIEFTMEEMLMATNRFQHKLGEGGFGYVYKGTLLNGREVAIKRSRNDTSGLLNELVTIGSLHHRNILKLEGFCITDKELMLVYDYMPNGNISDLLFGSVRHRVLDWGTRLKIILGVISALTYLHDGGDVCIVHRDIKPTNILLDENLNAKISDFGLARQVHRTGDDIPALIHNGKDGEKSSDIYRTTVAGTLGYIAPEYLEGGHMTKKGDIYSFGILVLEMISGRRALWHGGHEMVSITDLVWRLYYQHRLTNLVDTKLIDNEEVDFNNIFRTIMIALWCIQTDPNLRPSASQTLGMLSTQDQIPIAPPPTTMVTSHFEVNLKG